MTHCFLFEDNTTCSPNRLHEIGVHPSSGNHNTMYRTARQYMLYIRRDQCPQTIPLWTNTLLLLFEWQFKIY